MKYTIKQGDTLWALARKHGVSVDDLMRLNPQIKDRNKIYAGRTISLPDTGAAPPTNASPAAATPASAGDVTFPIPAPQPLPLQPPLIPPNNAQTTAPVAPNLVTQDEAAAAQGMAAMDPITAAALMGARPAMAAGQAAGAAGTPLPISLTSQLGATTPAQIGVTGGGLTWADLLYGKLPQMAAQGMRLR
jgi:murein DD-endopeptidase MepM/ murein hydrolase activator NlpD